MASGSEDVAAEAASVTQYRTFSDLELLCKRRLEAEEATAAHKAQQGRRLLENETRKRARIGKTLRGWLTGARNAGRLSLGGTDVGSDREPVLLLSSSSIASVDVGIRGGSDLQILSSTPGVVHVSSEESPGLAGRGDACRWSSDDLPDFQDDFDVVDEGEACDLGLTKQVGKKKHTKPVRSYELIRRFQIVWSAIWTWSEPVLARDGLLHQVRCLVCSSMDKKETCVMMPKRSTLEKHDLSMRHK